jgi:hypothetical protein
MLGKVVILEGPDGAGKTTLATHLEQEHGFHYIHTGKPSGNGSLLVEYCLILDEARRSGEKIVIDRLHVGESVYGPLMRGTDLITSEGQDIIQRFINAMGAVEVFCLPPYEVCERNWAERHFQGREYVTEVHKFRAVYAAYDRFFRLPRHSKAMHYDYTSRSMGDTGETIVKTLEGRQGLPLECIGSLTGRFLVVGEIANQEKLDAPWVDLGNSSHFLNTALWEAGFTEDELVFMNAKKLDGTKNGPWLTAAELNLCAIALGGVASKSFGKYPHHSLPHPAYWKRFHSGKRQEYVERLRKIRNQVRGS